MSEETKEKIPLIDIVNRRYKVFKEYEKVFLESRKSPEELMEKVEPFLESEDTTDEEFQDFVKELYVERSIQAQDTAHLANKFIISVDLFNLTQEGKLDNQLLEDYLKIKNQQHKTVFFVDNGKFVKNTTEELPKIPQEQFDYFFDIMKKEFGN